MKLNLTSREVENLKASLQDRNLIDITRKTGKPRKVMTSFREVITRRYVPALIYEELDEPF